jgi:hypothetical protein
MPLQQSSWVELWLDRYCQPGRHRFRPLRPDVLICERCFKEELLDGHTCLICGIPGEHYAELQRAGKASETRSGLLCGECFDEFGERSAIKGWMLKQAS